MDVWSGGAGARVAAWLAAWLADCARTVRLWALTYLESVESRYATAPEVSAISDIFPSG